MSPKLGVNVDHIATLRQARRGLTPSPVWAARAAQAAGADSIVCHLREDRRHIQDRDLPEIKRSVRRLNLEMAAHPEIVRICCRLRPYQATLVPERRQELTTEGGLDLRRGRDRIRNAVRRLAGAGIRVSLFIDPDPDPIRRAVDLGVPMIELHTGRYAEAAPGAARRRELEKLKKAVRLGRSEGLIVAAGHGLDYENVKAVAAIPEMEELNIGFSIVAKAVEVGFHRAVMEMVRLAR
jgi:pyridoxine 5-phosphate synthase